MSASKQPSNGKSASASAGACSVKKRQAPGPGLQRGRAHIFDQYQRLDDRASRAKAREAVVFHKTDWLGDLNALARFYLNPAGTDPETAGHAVTGMLYHVMPHLEAAARLLLNYQGDTFVSDREDCAD